MIPYEELVIALQTWRAKQGLPVLQLSGALTPPPVVTPPSGPNRQAPPVTPPRPNMPLPAPEDSMDVDESALIEEAHYENEGDDFAMAFGAAGVPGADAPAENDSTAIGGAPRPSDTTLDDGSTEVASPGGQIRSHNRNDDW